MVRLARRYGLSPVAQVLRVNYTALKRHLAATQLRKLVGPVLSLRSLSRCR